MYCNCIKFFCEHANEDVLNICSLMAYSLVCLDLYLNPITTRTSVSSYMLYFACPRFLLFISRGPGIKPIVEFDVR